jgi:hypothetical protein
VFIYENEALHTAYVNVFVSRHIYFPGPVLSDGHSIVIHTHTHIYIYIYIYNCQVQVIESVSDTRCDVIRVDHHH